MASLGSDSIKNELLKNIVNVASFHISKNTRAGMQLGDQFSSTMNYDQIAVVLFNNITRHGVEKGYELLNDANILFSVCNSFADYRREGKKETLDYIGKTNSAAMYIHNELDTYYARYGDKPKEADTTVLDSHGYDSNGGFSGFGRK